MLQIFVSSVYAYIIMNSKKNKLYDNPWKQFRKDMPYCTIRCKRKCVNYNKHTIKKVWPMRITRITDTNKT